MLAIRGESFLRFDDVSCLLPREIPIIDVEVSGEGRRKLTRIFGQDQLRRISRIQRRS